MLERRAFIISTLLSVFSMYLVYSYLDGENKDLNEKYGVKVPVVVAIRNILQFETIRPTDLDIREVPKSLVPPGYISDPKDIIDAIASIPLSKGEYVVDNKIISKNIYSGLDTQVAMGKRAISIPVNVKSAIGYNLRPGNRVDLAAHFEYKSGATNISEVKVFLQDVLILASGKTIQTKPPMGVDQGILRGILENFKELKEPQEAQEVLNHAKTDVNFQTVTLELSPIQSQVVVYVMTVFPDSLVLLLRHSDDRQLERKIATTNLNDVMGPESYLVRGKQTKTPPPRAVPRTRFYDFQGESVVPN